MSINHRFSSFFDEIMQVDFSAPRYVENFKNVHNESVTELNFISPNDIHISVSKKSTEIHCHCYTEYGETEYGTTSFHISSQMDIFGNYLEDGLFLARIVLEPTGDYNYNGTRPSEIPDSTFDEMHFTRSEYHDILATLQFIRKTILAN